MSNDQKPKGFGTAINIPLTEEEFSALGKITALFGAIDFNIEMLIIHLSQSSLPVFEALAGKAPFSAKIAMVEQLNSLKGNDNRPGSTEIKDLCTHLRKVVRLRNLVVHGWWGTKRNQLRMGLDGKLVEDGSAVTAAVSRDRVVLASQLPEILEMAEEGARLVCIATERSGLAPASNGAKSFTFADPSLRK